MYDASGTDTKLEDKQTKRCETTQGSLVWETQEQGTTVSRKIRLRPSITSSSGAFDGTTLLLSRTGIGLVLVLGAKENKCMHGVNGVLGLNT